MHVRVLKAGAEQRAVDPFEAGVLADERARFALGHDRADAALGDGYDVSVDRLAGSGEHGCSGEQQIGGWHVALASSLKGQ